ncbi:CpsD/CapB family tyrosine-protein kinase [Neobacillus sp. WH10]|uniref:CpsD/CapB family tyrosine-protein kinase n=1 Tax=Neobacillus sp. WH10 TaxID=3047873 RepID=UPI0024C1D1D4|nr:CpsD/CapB family tyrosine-protein kinase [Neobacillus sp. WH10]WHY76646.1 CpsD/CapB family tyrosine-protein kinase [Neobacillus sp. WH10]
MASWLKKKVNKKVKLISYHNLKSPITEQYRLIRNNLHFASVDKEIKTIAITSPEPSDGKSTTSANLAIVLAQQGKQVLLVDGDLRKPSIHYTFNVSNIDGLTTVLTKDIALVEAISKTHIPNLDILSSGSIPPNPSELLNSKSMEIIMDELKILYDYIIFDTPPILLVTESQIMASKCNGVILVIASGKTKKEKAMKAKELLEQANSQILGVVVNGVKAKGDFYSSDYYG